MENKSGLLRKLGFYLMIMIGVALISTFDDLKWVFVNFENYQLTTGRVVKSSIVGGGLYGGWRFSVQYEYKVKDQTYISDRVHFGYQASSDISYAEEYISRYPVGKLVQVFYDPKHPQNALLEPKVKRYETLVFYIFLIFLDSFLFYLSYCYQYKNQSRIISPHSVRISGPAENV